MVLYVGGHKSMNKTQFLLFQGTPSSKRKRPYQTIMKQCGNSMPRHTSTHKENESQKLVQGIKYILGKENSS